MIVKVYLLFKCDLNFYEAANDIETKKSLQKRAASMDDDAT